MCTHQSMHTCTHIYIYIYIYIYKFARDQAAQSAYFSTVFALPRGRASEAAQASILSPKSVPKRP